MQLLIFLALVVIILLLAPWLFAPVAALLAIWGTAAVVLAVLSAVIVGAATIWISYTSNPDRQAAKMEKRIKKITDAANRANRQKE